MSRPEPDTAAVDAALARRMIEIRRHLHRNPELSNAERETQAYLKHALEEVGLGPVRTVAGFGLAVDIVGTASTVSPSSNAAWRGGCSFHCP